MDILSDLDILFFVNFNFLHKCLLCVATLTLHIEFHNAIFFWCRKVIQIDKYVYANANSFA